MPTNQTPDAVNNSGLVLLEDTALTLTPGLLLGNDRDPDGNSLSIQSVQNAVGGSVGFDQDGNVVFTPTANYTGAASFTYTISDGNGGTDTATATLTVRSDEVSLASIAVRAATDAGDVSSLMGGDFNGDGLADILLTDASTMAYRGVLPSVSGSLTTTLNGGSFAASSSYGPFIYNFFSPVNSGAGFGDVNNDGIVDALTMEGGWHRSLAIHLGSATPNNSTDLTLDSGVGYFSYGSQLTVADFNGDGLADIFSGSHNSSAVNGASATTPTLAMWLGGSGGFATSPTATAYTGVVPANQVNAAFVLGAVDINNDGYDDIVTSVGGRNGPSTVAGPTKITFGNAAGTFAVDLSSNSGGLILDNFNFAGGDPIEHKIAVGGDVNGDGLADMAGWSGSYPSAPTGGFLLFGSNSLAAGASVDIAALNGQNGVKLTGVSSGVSSMALGDLNGDGLSDIVVGSRSANSGAGKLWIVWGQEGGYASGTIDLSQEPTGQFMTLTGASGQGAGTALAIADIDGDGHNDLIIGSRSGTIDVIGYNALPVNNAAPVAQGETVNGAEDQALTISAATLLGNDTDVNGDTLNIASVGNAVGGTAVLNADGSVTFTPTANLNGTATFEYMVSDGRGGTATATATVNLAAVNDAAVVSIDPYTFVGADQVSSQYQADISNFINVLTDTHETVALPEQYRNGAGPITLDGQDREVIVHFHSEVAGNQSVVGFYAINADGSFGPVQLVFSNASQTPPVLDPDDPGNPSDTYSSVSLGTLPADSSFGLFMISNGAGNAQTAALIQQVVNGTAQLSFVNGGNAAQPASLFDGLPPQLMVHALNTAASTGTAVDQGATPIFHTAASATAHFNGQTLDTLGLNTDGMQHVAAGQGEMNDGANTPAPDRIAIGWEDLAAGQNADFDFNDVILQVEVSAATIPQVNPANVGAAANLVLSDIDHADPANADLSGAVFRIAGGFVSGDVLQLSGSFSISTGGAVLNQGQATGISMVGGGFGGDPANPHGLSFTGLADLTLYEQVLRSVTFTSSSAAIGVHSFDITVTDDGNATSAVAVEHLAVGASGGQTPVFGTTGNDSLAGAAASDFLFGNDGSDTVNGGTGNDILVGGNGSDTYVVARGDGVDTVSQSDITDAASTTDILRFSTGVAYDQLWFRQSGNDLRIDVIGEAASSVVLSGWYSDVGRRADSIQTADGSHSLAATDVQALVDAMASYSPPPVGQTVLDSQVANDLAPVFATAWA